jgi:hypothetical protein
MEYYLLTIKEYEREDLISIVLIGDTYEDIEYLVEGNVTDDEYCNVERWVLTEITARQAIEIEEHNLETIGKRNSLILSKNKIHSCV